MRIVYQQDASMNGVCAWVKSRRVLVDSTMCWGEWRKINPPAADRCQRIAHWSLDARPLSRASSPTDAKQSHQPRASCTPARSSGACPSSEIWDPRYAANLPIFMCSRVTDRLVKVDNTHRMQPHGR